MLAILSTWSRPCSSVIWVSRTTEVGNEMLEVKGFRDDLLSLLLVSISKAERHSDGWVETKGERDVAQSAGKLRRGHCRTEKLVDPWSLPPYMTFRDVNLSCNCNHMRCACCATRA